MSVVFTADLAMRYLARLGDDEHLLEQIRRCVADGQATGDFPPRRDPPSGEEQVVYIVTDEPGGGHALLGYATFYEVSHKRVWLDFLQVAPSRRRTGIGTALIREVERRARAGGSEIVLFGTGVDNEAMWKLAEKLGYPITSVGFEKAVEP